MTIRAPPVRRALSATAPGLDLEGGWHLRRRSTVAYETWGALDRRRRQRRPRPPRPDRRHPRRRARRTRASRRRVVGRADRAGRRHRHRPLLRGLPQRPRAAARAPPGRRRRRPTARRTGSRFPVVTIRDQVAVEAALADRLGIDRWAAVVGGSMGGMRVLEWCVGHPDRVERAVVLAVGAAPPPSRSPCARCRSGPSGPTRPSPAATTTTPATGPAAGLAIARGHRSGQLPDRAGAREPVRPDRPGGGGPAARAAATPSSPTSSTTATSWSDASTPTPTSC